MSRPDETPDSQRDADAAELQRFGYAQQLLRDMGGFSSFALSFSVISILTGGVSLYGDGLKNGGPLVMSVGWPLVTLVTLAIAASLAELASAFPTAGALYHWSALLGGPGWGFATAWLNTIGQFAITAAIDYGLAGFVVDLLGLPGGRKMELAVCVAVLLSQAILNHVGVRAVALLNRVSAWYHLAGVALVVGVLSSLAPHQPIAFLLARHTTGEHGYGYSFLIALLQAAWTFTGYDASAHVTEETVDPTRNAPWGIFLSVVVSGVVGYAMLLVVTLSIGDLGQTVAAKNPFLFLLGEAVRGPWSVALVWIAIGAMWFCGLSSVTSNSRMLFAFARDGGLPGSRHLAKVSARFRSPYVAVWTSAAAALGVALWADLYAAMAALSTIALYASYALPIAVGLRARRAGKWRRRGPWNLGRFSTVVNVIALAWTGFALVIFVLPPNQLVGYTFAGCVTAIAIYWRVWMKARFAGPKIRLAEEEAAGEAAG